MLKQTKDFALLEVSLLTGRKNQIRVHLAGIGHPIVGDRKYGRVRRIRPRLALHARSIAFKHPFSGRRLADVIARIFPQAPWQPGPPGRAT